MDGQEPKMLYFENLSLSALLTFLARNYKTLVYGAIVSGVLGILIAFTLRVEYSASCKLLYEQTDDSDMNLGSLGGLASLAGVNLESLSSSSFSTELFPEIIHSTPFLTSLLDSEIETSRHGRITSRDYLTDVIHRTVWERSTDGITSFLLTIRSLLVSEEAGSVSDTSIVYLSREDLDLLEGFRERVSISIDSEGQVIVLSSLMPDPIAAAELADRFMNALTAEISQYRLNKARNNLDFIQERYEYAFEEYEKKQESLAEIMDRNLHLSSSMSQIGLQIAENEMELAFGVYRGLAEQLEQAKIRIEEDRPVFTPIEPVRIPLDKSQPRRILIVFGMSFIGFCLSFVFILVKPRIAGLRNLRDND